MAGFEELGLKEALVASARDAGFDAPSSLQRSVIPVLRRGGNAIIHAGSGSGATAAYGLALLDQFSDAKEPRALVIVPTNDRAERVARTIARLGNGTGVRVAALTGAWSAADNAAIVVTSAEKLLSAIEESLIKLDQIESVVVEGTSAGLKLTGTKAFETIFTSLPREGQRVFVSSEMTDDVRKIAESHARKALTFPARPAVEEAQQKTEPTAKLRYVVATADRKADSVARLTRAQGGGLTLLARSGASAREAEREMRDRGFDASALALDAFDRDEAAGLVVAWDVPFSAEQLTERLRDGDLIVVERDQLSHVKQIAESANVRLESVAPPLSEPDSLNAFRNEIRKAIREEDIEAQMLVLAPLFSEFSAEEVAAAVASLLRAKRPLKAESTGARPGTKTWSRLFLSVGERDGMRASDIVGAITGESGIRGDEVGKVEIRDTFSVVEVASTVADKVINALNGTTMKGRALRVDYDRKTSSGPPRGERGARPDRGARPARPARPEGGNREGGNRGSHSERGRPQGGKPPGRRPGPRSPSRGDR